MGRKKDILNASVDVVNKSITELIAIYNTGCYRVLKISQNILMIILK